jgi:hypothetical protein
VCVQTLLYRSIGQTIRLIYIITPVEQSLKNLKPFKICSLSTFPLSFKYQVTFPKPQNRISNPRTYHQPRTMQALSGIMPTSPHSIFTLSPFSLSTISLAESPSQPAIKPNHTTSLSSQALSACSSIIYSHLPFLIQPLISFKSTQPTLYGS